MLKTDNLATVFGLGYTLWFPGTAASLLAFSLAILAVSFVGFWFVWILAALLVPLGFRVCRDYALAHAKWDASECVIDEFAAVFLIACFMPLHLPAWFAAFIVFRIVDIAKPFPLNEIENLMEPGPRIMLDDLAAALLAMAAGWATYFAWLILGL